MDMLKKSWDEVSKKLIQNCFRKAGILMQSQESVMDESDVPFKGITNNDDDAIGELEFDVDQLREVNVKLAPDYLEAHGLFNIDTDVATNDAQQLIVEEITN